MNTQSTIDADLQHLGDWLQSAATHRLAQARSRRRRLRTLAVAASALALIGTAAGITAAVLKSPSEEEHGLPNAEAIFIGTHPHCTTVSAQEFHCVLASRPTVEYIEGSYRGATMSSVDRDKRIDGGCIATSDDGLIWQCYLGQEAVRRHIIDSSLLGQLRPEPGHG